MVQPCIIWHTDVLLSVCWYVDIKGKGLKTVVCSRHNKQRFCHFAIFVSGYHICCYLFMTNPSITLLVLVAPLCWFRVVYKLWCISSLQMIYVICFISNSATIMVFWLQIGKHWRRAAVFEIFHFVTDADWWSLLWCSTNTSGIFNQLMFVSSSRGLLPELWTLDTWVLLRILQPIRVTYVVVQKNVYYLALSCGSIRCKTT